MSDIQPKTIFRYRDISVNSLLEITTSSFYASKPSAFNDPFDCDFYWDGQLNEDLKNHLVSINNTQGQLKFDKVEMSSLEEGIKNDVQNLGIVCFTTDPLNPLMWAHYSNSHRGICIEYKVEGVLESETFRKVKYNRADKVIVNSFELIKNGYDMGSFFDDIVYSKLKEWKYEEEWRLMLIQPTKRLISLASPIESVTFGLKCPDAEVIKVLNILKLNFLSGITKAFRVRITNKGTMEREEINLPVSE
ncbi:DUF2971 domain-containing protein [Pseudoalteromonas sp. SA25]|uniref:DUF2971 domain-containing protein n=1 Tax=Pseudoalteromonas sp. SA25 TaxID=2686347 RepID=UPI0013FDEDFE|nr:DUF2971 domain-containing protein [Pseudoalteromonas sp. SA25]